MLAKFVRPSHFGKRYENKSGNDRSHRGLCRVDGCLVCNEKAADDREKKDADTIIEFSNQLTTATVSLDELRQVNLMLTNDLASSRQEALTFSNQFTETSGTLAETKTSLQTARDQITSLDTRSPIWRRKTRRWISARPR